MQPEHSESPRDDPDPRMGPGTAAIFRLSIWIAVAAGVLLVLDLTLGLRLPQSVRPALPVVLAIGMCVALVLGVAAYGAPSRPDQDRNEEPGPS